MKLCSWVITAAIAATHRKELAVSVGTSAKGFKHMSATVDRIQSNSSVYPCSHTVFVTQVYH